MTQNDYFTVIIILYSGEEDNLSIVDEMAGPNVSFKYLIFL